MKRQNKMRLKNRWATILPILMFAILLVPVSAQPVGLDYTVIDVKTWKGAWIFTEAGRIPFWHISHGKNPFLEECEVGRESGQISGYVDVVDYVNGVGCIDKYRNFYERIGYQDISFNQIQLDDIVVYTSVHEIKPCILYNCRYSKIAEIMEDGVIVMDYGETPYSVVEVGRYVPKEDIMGVLVALV